MLLPGPSHENSGGVRSSSARAPSSEWHIEADSAFGSFQTTSRMGLWRRKPRLDEQFSSPSHIHASFLTESLCIDWSFPKAMVRPTLEILEVTLHSDEDYAPAAMTQERMKFFPGPQG